MTTISCASIDRLPLASNATILAKTQDENKNAHSKKFTKNWRAYVRELLFTETCDSCLNVASADTLADP